MIRRPPRSTLSSSSAASDVYKRQVSLEDGFIESQYRESRNENGNLSFLNKIEAKSLLKGTPVYNTETQEIEKF